MWWVFGALVISASLALSSMFLSIHFNNKQSVSSAKIEKVELEKRLQLKVNSDEINQRIDELVKFQKLNCQMLEYSIEKNEPNKNHQRTP
jgi:hypothetical protein